MNYIDKIRENSLWAIGNVIISSMALKTRLLDEYRVCILIRDSVVASKNVTVDYLNIIMWLLSILIREGLQQKDHIYLFEPVLVPLGEYLADTALILENGSLCVDIMNFLSAIASHSETGIALLMENMAGLAETLTNFMMQFENFHIFKAAIRLTGDILSSERVEYCESFLKYGLLSAITIGWNTFKAPEQNVKLGNDEKLEVDKLFCWVISNIAASPSPEIV